MRRNSFDFAQFGQKIYFLKWRRFKASAAFGYAAKGG